jgi:hypothetical protein
MVTYTLAMYMSAGSKGHGVSVALIATFVAVAAVVVAFALFCIWYRRKRSGSHAAVGQGTNASPPASTREDPSSSAAQDEKSADSRVDMAAVLIRNKDIQAASDKLSSTCDSLAASRADSSLKSFNLQTKLGLK